MALTSITAAKLSLLLKISGQIVTIKDKRVITELEISNSNYDLNGLKFVDCEFIDNVFIQNVDLKNGIKFIRCNFQKNLIFKNSTVSQFDSDFNPDNESVYIKSCKIEKDIVLHTRNKILRETVIEETTFGSLQINGLISTEGGLHIQKCTINNNSHIGQNYFIHDISFSETLSNGSFRFENNRSSGYTFKGNTFEKDAWIWSGEAKGGIIFNDGVYKGEFRIQSVVSKQYLSIYNAKFESEFKVEYVTINSEKKLKGGCPIIHIGDSEFNNGLKIIGGADSNEFYPIDTINLTISKKLKGEITFCRFEIMQLTIKGNNYDSNIIFDDNTFVNLEFDHFSNFGIIQFIDGKASSNEFTSKVFSINKSILGKTFFTNVSFAHFNSVLINNSHITDIITSNVEWFGDDNLNPKTNPTSEDYILKREVYRQLKYAYEKQGNRVDSLMFKALEMHTYKRELFAKYKWHTRIFHNDRFILWIGQTNNFGKNWWKPALIALGFGFLFYFLIIIGISERLDYRLILNRASFHLTFSEMKDYIYTFPQLMNPAHFIDKVFPESNKIGFGAHFWDYTLKIFLAFFIFQIISAFRKFMK